MTIEQAITELKEDIDLYIPKDGIIDRETPDGRLITALEMAILALREHNDYKTAWDNLKKEVERKKSDYYSKDRQMAFEEVFEYMRATEEEITDCYIARRLKEAENGKG